MLSLWQCVLLAGESPTDNSIPAIYIDELIDPGTVDADFDPVYREYTEQPAGRRYLSAGLVHFLENRNRQGNTRESGMDVLYRQETRDYGELEAELSLLNVSSASTRTSDPSSGALLTLRQRGFALDNNWVMDSLLGVERTAADPVLANSYRFKLPSSLQSGLSTRLISRHGDIRFGIGRLGNLDTGTARTFESTAGQLLSLGYSRKTDSHYHSGVQLVSVSNAAIVPDHTSIAGVIQHDDPALKRRLQAHLLGDSEGASGIWLDGDFHNSVWRKRFGLFRLEPNLLWSDTTMSSDQQGVYARIERRSLRNHLSAGMEINSTDIEDNPLVNGLRTVSAFVNGGRYIDIRTSVGGTLSIRDVSSTDGVSENDSGKIEVSAYTNKRFSFGTSRLQGLLADVREGDSHGLRSGITLDQSWELHGDMALSATLGFETERNTGSDSDRVTAGLLFRRELGSILRWDASINWSGVSRSASGSNGNSLNASAAVFWRFMPGWEAGLRARINDASQSGASGIGATDFDEREKTLLLSIRHSRTTGRAFDRYGHDTGKTGYGTVEGVVFYDENRDGIQQAGEERAAGVYVYLDGRYQKVTDLDGLCEFSPVTAGDHAVSLMLEDIPLPWGLDDESPRHVTVNVRGRTTVVFPLVRFDE